MPRLAFNLSGMPQHSRNRAVMAQNHLPASLTTGTPQIEVCWQGSITGLPRLLLEFR